MTAALTPRQTEILDRIRGYIAARGFSPSIRDVADMMGDVQPNAARALLDRLEKSGFIRRIKGDGGRRIPRSIVVTAPPSPSKAGSHGEDSLQTA
jgi:SOS-response transcriptional repressor LexA